MVTFGHKLHVVSPVSWGTDPWLLPAPPPPDATTWEPRADTSCLLPAQSYSALAQIPAVLGARIDAAARGSWLWLKLLCSAVNTLSKRILLALKKLF